MNKDNVLLEPLCESPKNGISYLVSEDFIEIYPRAYYFNFVSLYINNKYIKRSNLKIAPGVISLRNVEHLVSPLNIRLCYDISIRDKE